MVAEESRDEVLARHIVSTSLRVPVLHHDDQSSPRMVDALIDYGDRQEALEVVGDDDPAFHSQWDALVRCNHRIDVPAATASWHVSLKTEARVDRLSRILGALLPEMERASSDNLRTAPEHLDALVAQAENAGITNVWCNPVGDPGVVHLQPAGWAGFATGADLADWVESMLGRHPDVPRKLAAHPTAAGHAFLWVTMTSDIPVQFEIENGDHPLRQHRDPVLPDGVSHVWVAGRMSTLGTVAWFPDRGWWRTPWIWPARLDLDRLLRR